MRNVIGINDANLGMEPYTGVSENTDVVFVESNDGYVPLVDDHFSYLEESIPSNIDTTQTNPSINGPYLRIQTPSPYKLADGDYATQFYLGAVSVLGLFILFRMMQKSKA